MSSDALRIVDLFAGAGGLSTGIALACEELGIDPGTDVDLHAINHWEPAIETHERNHPWATHYNAKIEELHPPDVVEPGSVDLLAGGPECTHFSTARGGKPVSEQKRASAWHVLDWVEKLRPEHVLLENVPEFRDWGPILEGEPSRDGSIFERWVGMFEALGYSVVYDELDEDHGVVLNAADYGDPQSRRRLFIMASRSKQPTPPEPTHDDDDPAKPSRRTAADIIDWGDLGTSLWTRDLENPRVQPLSKNTMERIAEGIRRHCDGPLRELADVLETIGEDELRELRETVVPVEYADVVAEAVDRPFLVHAPAIDRVGLSTAAILRQQSGGVPAAVDAPLPTISTTGAIGMTVAEGRSLVQPRNGPARGLHSNPVYPAEDRPIHTVTASNHDGHLATPSLIHYSHGGAIRDLEQPMPTIATEKGGAFALSAPYLVEYHGNSTPVLLDEPIGTIETVDRYALCVPECWPWGIDVRYRMLKPDELKQAQGFPEDYEIVGSTKKCVTAQIGNAVPVHLARALVLHLLADETPSLSTYGGGIQADPNAEVPEYAEVLPGDD